MKLEQKVGFRTLLKRILLHRAIRFGVLVLLGAVFSANLVVILLVWKSYSCEVVRLAESICGSLFWLSSGGAVLFWIRTLLVSRRRTDLIMAVSATLLLGGIMASIFIQEGRLFYCAFDSLQ